MGQTIPENEFRLGLTMAGAISAGCYTGGVMDYLLEMLDLWEKAKNGQLPEFEAHKHKIPKHKVIIDAMGGASAGAMTTTMAAIYALNGNINPVTNPDKCKELTGNLLYDSWVFMDDKDPKDNRSTFEKVWDKSDLEKGLLHSILNSSFVDRIADSAFNYNGNIKDKADALPSYISKDLQIILSHCLLRGIPLDVSFETPIAQTGRSTVLPNHTTYEHYIISHYHLNKGLVPDENKYLFFNPYDTKYNETLKLSTKATGAFPVGLIYREFTKANFSTGYLKTIFNRILSGEFGKADPDPTNIVDLKHIPDDYNSITVDGGAINNEPYREVLSILKDNYGEPTDDNFASYGVVMIDPFPDMVNDKEEYVRPKDLVDVIPDIINTLQHQSRVKRREMLENDSKKYFKSIIFPRKWIPTEKKGGIKPDPNPIACASVGAFGGFMEVSFRHHDFFLGRNNARNFFRYFFSMPYEPDKIVHPIHKSWTQDMIDVFKIEKDGKIFLPIIPDLNLLREGFGNEIRYTYSVKDKPTFNPESLFNMREVIKERILRIITVLKKREYGTSADKALTNEWMQTYYRKGLFKKIGGSITKGFINLIFGIGKGSVAKSLTEKIIRTILSDLEAKGMLKKIEKNN